MTKMADKVAASYQFATMPCCSHSDLVIVNWISSNFHIWIAPITLWFKLEYDFCPTTASQDGQPLAASYQFALVDTLLKSFITRLLPKFIYRLLLSKSHPSLNMGFVS